MRYIINETQTGVTEMPSKIEIKVGEVIKFGYRGTPYTVTEIGFAYPTGDYPIRLKGPKGADKWATVYTTGRIRMN
jgi:hypothetical protein